MYDYTGVSCSVCRKAFEQGDDIVVCPDCGAPYHRACYETVGSCVYSAKHAEGFVWEAPAQAQRTQKCTRCGCENPLDNTYCKDCGAPMTSNQAQPDAARRVRNARSADPTQNGANGAANGAFDYEAFYRSPYTANPYSPPIDPNETMEGIPAAEWASYIGPNSGRYLNIFKQMELLHRKYSISFSAMLFGPFYFFYRKAWKPAFIFLAAELALNIPSFWALLQVSGSALVPALSDNALSVMSTVASVASFVLMVLRGMYGFYFYKKSAAARIRRIQSEYPDPEKRSFVLSAQGGISILAVLGVMAALALFGTLFSLLLGPNLDAVISTLYG
jgi:hypothetical protein